MTAALVLMLCSLTACEPVEAWIRMPMVACMSPQGQIAAAEWMRVSGETRRLQGYRCEVGQPA